MCFSENISLFAFIVGMAGSMLVYSLGEIYDKIYGIFHMFISFMQLVDFFLWRNQTCDAYNYIISITGIILNHLQPLVLGLLILYYNTRLSYQDKIMILCILCIYLCVIIPYSWQYINKTQCTLKNSNNHLDWKWNWQKYHVFAYGAFVLTLLLLYFRFVPVYGKLFAIIAVFSFISSAIIYKNELGNMWCFYSLLFPILYYLFRGLKAFNN